MRISLAGLKCFLLLAVAGILFGAPASAHEVRPAYLEVTETTAGQFDVTWKQPVLDGRRLKLDPAFPEACKHTNDRVDQAGNTLVQRWQTSCDLSGGTIGIDGLDRTLTDVFVRVDRLNGENSAVVLRPGNPVLDLSGPQGAAVPTYFRIGVEHILFGWDHLLFVLGMVLLVRPRQLLWTLTAFTLAHSITLAAATLGGITLPGPPVEITIAMSIALLGAEAIHRLRGRMTLSQQVPWAIAFGFGYGGTTTVFPAIVGDRFGRAHAGAIVGLLFAGAGSAAAVTAWIGAGRGLRRNPHSSRPTRLTAADNTNATR